MIPALLLAAAARMGYRVTARDASGLELGVFVEGSEDRALLMASAEGALVQWVLDVPRAGFAPYLLSRQTYDILHEGSLNADGTVTHRGRNHRIEAWFDGAHLTARAIPTEAAAA